MCIINVCLGIPIENINKSGEIYNTSFQCESSGDTYIYICNRKGIVRSAFGDHHIPLTTVRIPSDSHGCACEGKTRNLYGHIPKEMIDLLEQTLTSLNC
jgi:hypothetical protein